MTKKRKLDHCQNREELARKIIGGRKEGISIRNIAKTYNLPPTTVYRLSCPSSKNTLQPKQKKADLQEKKFGNQIVSILTKNLFFSLKEISNALGGKINTKIIRNILKKRGYKYKKFNPVPFISALQKQRRIEFSVSHIFNNTDFSGVVFSDEKNLISEALTEAS